MVKFADITFSFKTKKSLVDLDFNKIELYTNFLNTNLFGAYFPYFLFVFLCYLDAASLPRCLLRTQTPKSFPFFFFFFFIHSLLLPCLFIFPFLSLSSTRSLFLLFHVSSFLFFFSFFFTFLHTQPHKSLPLSCSLCPKMGCVNGYRGGSFMSCCCGFFFFFGDCGLKFMGCSG